MFMLSIKYGVPEFKELKGRNTNGILDEGYGDIRNWLNGLLIPLEWRFTW
jgi:hypothetical protein